MDFFKHLNYSLGNEDWNVEQQGLRVNPGDHAVCVTASGDRPLHLLMTDCAKVTSLDMNHIQNHLLELKLAAIHHLDYEKYLAFMGCTSSRKRLSILREIQSHLSPTAADFWLKRSKSIRKGILYQGRTERLTKITAKFFKLFRRKNIKRLFAFDNIEEQREFVNKHWDTPSWRLFFEVFANPKFSKIILDDPGLNAYVEYTDKPGKYIYERMHRYLNAHLAKHSALLQLLLLGKVMPEAYFPYLTEDGYKKIRSRQGDIDILTTNITEYLRESAANSIDCFSLSDIASYMPQEAFEMLLESVRHAAKPGARFCIREFMSRRSIPTHLSEHFKRQPELEYKMEVEESNFVYRFMVGEIQKQC